MEYPILTYKHKPKCAVVEARQELLLEFAKEAHGKGPYHEASNNLDYLLGAAVEYFGGGDQEAEECTCGAIPYQERYKDINAQRIVETYERGVSYPLRTEIYGEDLNGKRVWISIHLNKDTTRKTRYFSDEAEEETQDRDGVRENLERLWGTRPPDPDS